VTDEISQVIRKLREMGIEEIGIGNPNLASSIREKYDLKVRGTGPTRAGRVVRGRLCEFAEELLSLEVSEFYELNHEVSQLIARKRVKDAMSNRVNMLIQTVQLLSDLDDIINSLSNRLVEWYSLHFPELDRILSDHLKYSRIVRQIGHREDITENGLRDIGINGREAGRIIEAAQSSMGAPISDYDLQNLQNLADENIRLYGYRERLREYISGISEDIAPNTAELAGPILAGKLIEKAGGLKELAMLPASTIQVLGAEKAMYRAIKTGAKPPKHGVIFQHPHVHSARRGDRGKKARELAGKIAIAARADFFSGNQIAEELKMELERG
ncbi:MAG: C/D box methylation guide ribonucleoprotein complex aNOP56 subunit, partial [Candidatus Bathyarchaeia archaeon]